MNSSIDWFLKEMVSGKTLGMVKDTALAMILVRPQEERVALKKLVLDKIVREKKEAMQEKAFEDYMDEEEDSMWRNHGDGNDEDQEDD
jgi:hypothetical protein